MVRLLPKFSMHKIPFLPVPFITFIIVLSIFSIITFLCASHKFTRSQRPKAVKTVRLGCDQKKFMTKLQSSISSKALLMANMISWRKVQDHDDEEEYDDDDDDDDEEAVWKKTIIMGERCRPLEFSGKILYDCHGNPLPDNNGN